MRCAANATDLIELIALQTRNKASGGYQGGTCACSSFAPSQHAAAVGTFKLFALPAHQISLPQTRGSKTTPLCSLSPHRAILLPLIIPSIHRSPPHSLPHQPLITPKHQQHQHAFLRHPLRRRCARRRRFWPDWYDRSLPRFHKLITRTSANPLPVTVTVTETKTDCGAAGMCPSIAARQVSSNGPASINALSVLSSAYYSAISAYASAQATDSSLPSFTFVPDLFSSYGLTDVASTNDPSSPTAAPSSNPTGTENSQTSIATSVVPVAPGASSASSPSDSGVPGVPATTPAATPSSASETPAAGESTTTPVESSATVAVPVPSSITDSSAASSYISSVQSSLSSEVTANPTGGESASPTDSASYTASPTDAESSAASTTESPTESSTDQSSSSSTEADAGSASTTEAPPAEQTGNAAGNLKWPMEMMALGGFAAGLVLV